MKLLRKVIPVFDSTLNIFAVLSAIVMVLLMLVVSAQIVSRYFFRHPWLGITEICSLALLYILFLGVAWVLRREGHVSLDLLTARLNPRNQHLINMITSIVCAIMCLVLVWYGTQMTWMRFQLGIYITEYLDILDGYTLVIIPIGCLLLLIQFLRRALGYFQKWKGATKPQT